MARYASVIIFFALLLSSAAASVGCYQATAREIVADLNKALAQTLLEKRSASLMADTIAACNRLQAAAGGTVTLSMTGDTMSRHISIPQLRDKACLQVGLAVGDGMSVAMPAVAGAGLCSDTVIWHYGRGGARVALRGYVRCSAASVFGMSDQRLPGALAAVAVLWAVCSMIYLRRTARRTADAVCYGGLCFLASEDVFRNASGERVHLTPMQHRLMRMFFVSASHRLTKDEICDALWPRKEDASDTLYTLVKRLKPVIEANSSLRIESDRGRAYALEDR